MGNKDGVTFDFTGGRGMPDLHRTNRLTNVNKPKTLNDWSEEVFQWRMGQGFYQPPDIEGDIDYRLVERGVTGDGETIDPALSLADINLGRLMLVVTELAEAAEAVRKGDWDNYVEELADTFIRLLDICGTQGIDIDAAIVAKMEKNRQRPRKHGKRA